MLMFSNRTAFLSDIKLIIQIKTISYSLPLVGGIDDRRSLYLCNVGSI